MRHYWLVCLAVFVLPLYGENVFQVGTGVCDITGPAAEVGMMGYARVDQQTSGIHTRLWAKAFVVQDPQGKRIVLVNTDIGMIMQAVKIKVVEKLQQKFGNLYTVKNVMLSATHTHSGPGGFSHYALYNITVLGFCRQNFDTVVAGIYQAIVKAHHSMAPARIFVGTGLLESATTNRSLAAYNANVDAKLYPPLDNTMVLLKFQRLDGQELGLINWFAVHATSIGNDNKLISSDNKGWAAKWFEMNKGNAFVAAFANSAEGDASPNIYGGQDGGGVNDFASTAISGKKQFAKAWQLYHEAGDEITTTLDYRHVYCDFSQATVPPEFADGTTRKTAFAALGVAFAAGAEDGPSNIPFIKEGDYQGHYDEGHGRKPIFLETGKMTPYPWTPEVLPVQMFILGKVAIMAVPGEFTSHAGRRIKEAVREELHKIGVEILVISGPANSYAGYVTTREEYNEQHYEGASTHFGQWTLGAYQHQFRLLARSLVKGTMPADGPQPRDLTDHQTELEPGVVFDAPPLFKDFGDVEKDAPVQVARMSVLNVVFWGAHPKNQLKINDTFLEIQQKVGQSWQTIRRDGDLDTAFIWQRDGIACSKITIRWDVSESVPLGIYRIRHSGYYKDGLTGEINSYAGQSREFSVVACSSLTVASAQAQGKQVKIHVKYPPATAQDLGDKTADVTTGKVLFKINGDSTIYEALPQPGQNYFEATVPTTVVNKIEVPSGFAMDVFGNRNS